MDKSELGPLLTRLYAASREQLNVTLELTCSLTAAIEVLNQVQPGFGAAYKERLKILKCSELKKEQVKEPAAFDALVGRLMKRYKA
jgi:hypothetical protein